MIPGNRGKWVVLAIFRALFSLYAKKTKIRSPQWGGERRKSGKRRILENNGNGLSLVRKSKQLTIIHVYGGEP